VWQFHEVYSDQDVKNWVQEGCRSAGIGCLDCKQPIIDAVLAEQAPIRERSEEYLQDRDAVQAIIDEGCETARDAARDTLDDVREAMNLVHR
jgi:tryptophanyl-tRNA synthetase